MKFIKTKLMLQPPYIYQIVNNV